MTPTGNRSLQHDQLLLKAKSKRPKAILRPVFILLCSCLFFILGTIGIVFMNKPLGGKELADHISNAIERELKKADKEAALLIQHPRDNELWSTVDYSFFLIDTTGIKAWSKNDFVPDFRIVFDPFAIKFLQVTNGDFLLKKWALTNNSFLLLVIPLHKNYTIVNKYLSPEWNTNLFDVPVGIIDELSLHGNPVCLVNGGCIFSVIPDTASTYEAPHYFIFLLFLGGISTLIIYLFGHVWTYHRRADYQNAFLGLTFFFGVLRIALVEFNFPNALVKFQLFDPEEFASSSFNASIGDLFLNSLVVLLLCVYLFQYYSKFKIIRWILQAGQLAQAVASIICLFVCFCALLFPYLYVEIIYHNSSISLEITESLRFGGTRTVALLSLILGCISSFLVIHIFIKLALRLQRISKYPYLPLLTSSALLFLIFFVLTGKSYWITLGLGSAYLILLFVTNLAVPLSRLTFTSFLYFLVVVILFSVQGTLSVRRFQEEKRKRDLFRYGNNFLVEQDVLGEYLLNESIHRIEKDPFIQLRLSTPFLSKASIRQKIKLFYLNSYFDRYDVQVYLYDASGAPFDNLFSVDFPNSSQNKKRNETIYKGIYFIKNPLSEPTKKYQVVVAIHRFGAVTGFVVLELVLKKVIPQNVYPELLVDNRFSQSISNPDFSYAFYSQGRLTSSFGVYNYEKYFDTNFLANPDFYRDGVKDNRYYHVGIEDKGGQVAVVTTLRYPYFFMITNFSFFFILGLGVILIFLSIAGLVSWFRGRHLNYSSRIQLYVYLAFFFPLLAVSVTTLSLISRSDEEQLTKEYEEKTRRVNEKIAISLYQLQDEKQSDQNDFRNKLSELAKLTNVDASVYDSSGLLLASSQPAIFENHLLSPLINRVAWTAIVGDKNNSFIANEQIGKLQYNCSYASIKSPGTGKLIGILSIPFFSSASSLEQSQMNVVSNILTVFVIVFILFSWMSFIVAKGLTFPLRYIIQSLKKTTLHDPNPFIVWNSTDEIGLLANEYNRMVQNLEQSKAELVRSQKESAWREIAKQVAHEIKNPLTPMKLTLQQWEKALSTGEDSPDKARKSIAILLAQLETLNEIAGSFSAFARMPAPILQRVELRALVKQVVDLHAPVHPGSIVFQSETDPLFIMGDEQLLGRIFSNLILNALQSGKEGQAVTVTIVSGIVGQDAVVEIRDDGRGIDEMVRERVFLPHFSTKKTGSGLGLAIARQGIEQSGGRIWFETSTGKGTVFFVQLPLAVDPE